mmetsp:Transcript_111734/g.256157  ORF Transcript_111734/g.256157 Transcript_111734/m.256157 type:complete len:393 (+) Transcript_111734:3-1181(+)
MDHPYMVELTVARKFKDVVELEKFTVDEVPVFKPSAHRRRETPPVGSLGVRKRGFKRPELSGLLNCRKYPSAQAIDAAGEQLAAAVKQLLETYDGIVAMEWAGTAEAVLKVLERPAPEGAADRKLEKVERLQSLCKRMSKLARIPEVIPSSPSEFQEEICKLVGASPPGTMARGVIVLVRREQEQFFQQVAAVSKFATRTKAPLEVVEQITTWRQENARSLALHLAKALRATGLGRFASAEGATQVEIREEELKLTRALLAADTDLEAAPGFVAGDLGQCTNAKVVPEFTPFPASAAVDELRRAMRPERRKTAQVVEVGIEDEEVEEQLDFLAMCNEALATDPPWLAALCDLINSHLGSGCRLFAATGELDEVLLREARALGGEPRKKRVRI